MPCEPPRAASRRTVVAIARGHKQSMNSSSAKSSTTWPASIPSCAKQSTRSVTVNTSNSPERHSATPGVNAHGGGEQRRTQAVAAF